MPNQYCRYCANAEDYNGDGTDFVCFADAPCGDSGNGIFYSAAKAKAVNHCKCESIGNWGFNGDYNLSKIELSESCTFGSSVFGACVNLYPRPDGSTN